MVYMQFFWLVQYLEKSDSYMKKWSFYNFSELLNLLLAASNIRVGHIRLLFNLHIKTKGKVQVSVA